ncbi:MAG: ABC transporter substrate-binding protein [Flavobacteriaceae bacterium]|nr:ABC transporter substrate-binding protein [Flavobacteriaceae bacterium]
MKKKLFLYIFGLFHVFVFAQDYSAFWQGHFSFQNIKDVSQGNDKVFAASENAIFMYDVISEDFKKITTINGLSGEFISTIHYSEIYELLLIGYENGLMEVYTEQEEDILTVVDIINKQNIPPDSKRINHFNEYNDVVYISTDYGISVYNIERLEFEDTYYIGNGGSQTIITQTTILNNYIYASSISSSGIKRALIESENLIDFNEWEQFRSGSFFSSVEAVENKLFTTKGKRIFRTNPGEGQALLFTYQDRIIDVKEINDKLLIATKSEVYIYDSFFNEIASFFIAEPYDTNFTSVTLNNNDVYIGSEDFGILKPILGGTENFIALYPEGPLRNEPFSIEAYNGDVWVSFGDYSYFYNPYPLERYGISYLSDETWNSISYDSIINITGQDVYSLNRITTNPFNPSEVYISSFFSGILVLIDKEVSTLYNEINSGLESLILPSDPNYKDIRVSGSIFDDQGLLWSISSEVDSPLKSYNPSTGQWQSYSFTEVIPSVANDNLGFSDVVISNDNTKWVGSSSNGLIAYNENGNNIKKLYDESIHNMPSLYVSALAIDNRNQLWIGTNKGLRVLYNTSGVFDNDNVTTQSIIFIEDGIPKELLENQYISDIKVDGSNNKWVGTIGSGVFYFTSDGQETIYHFTTDNSPLPSNYINEISIENVNGEVYFATEKGLVSFFSGGSKPIESLTDAFIYPNPVRPEFDMFSKKVKIKDISENCNIKITDIEGNLVAEAESRKNSRYKGYNLEIDGGTAYWNGRNLANNTVATGVYLVMLSDLDSLETRVLKVMIIR